MFHTTYTADNKITQKDVEDLFAGKEAEYHDVFEAEVDLNVKCENGHSYAVRSIGTAEIGLIDKVSREVRIIEAMFGSDADFCRECDRMIDSDQAFDISIVQRES